MAGNTVAPHNVIKATNRQRQRRDTTSSPSCPSNRLVGRPVPTISTRNATTAGTQLRSFTVLSRLFIQELRVQQLYELTSPPAAMISHGTQSRRRRGSSISRAGRYPAATTRSSSYGSFPSPGDRRGDRDRYKSGCDRPTAVGIQTPPVELTARRGISRCSIVTQSHVYLRVKGITPARRDREMHETASPHPLDSASLGCSELVGYSSNKLIVTL